MVETTEKVIAVAPCPKCGREYPLLDTALYDSENQPRKFPGPSTIIIPCCGDAQTVRAENVVYRPQRQFV